MYGHVARGAGENGDGRSKRGFFEVLDERQQALDGILRGFLPFHHNTLLAMIICFQSTTSRGAADGAWASVFDGYVTSFSRIVEACRRQFRSDRSPVRM